MEIMIPVWQEADGIEVVESAIKNLSGASVALIDDGYDAPFTDEVEKQLQEQYGAKVKRFNKPHGSSPSPEALIAKAARCDVAVVGIAL